MRHVASTGTFTAFSSGRVHDAPRFAARPAPGTRAAHTAAAISTGWKASGQGRVVSWTMMHRPHHAGFGPEAPYVFVAVALAERPLMYSRLAGMPAGDLGGHSACGNLHAGPLFLQHFNPLVQHGY